MPRRLSVLLVGGALAFSALSTPAFAADGETTAPSATGNLTILSTTDVHGHVMNWDYFKDSAYGAGKELGLGRAKTLIDQEVAANGKESTLILDNGDAIQGTPLTYLAALQPDKLGAHKDINPMSHAYNIVGYEAVVVGNHEFNYGLDYLKNTVKAQLKAPLLGANVLDATTNEPWLTPYTLIDKKVNNKAVKVGVLGVVTPGVRMWDKAIVEGKLVFQDPVLAAQKYVPEMKAKGADVVVVLIHSGLDSANYTWNPKDLEENVAKSLAVNTNGVDVVVGGHSHSKNFASEVFTKPDGTSVLFTQPYYWAQSVSKTTLPIDVSGEKPKVVLPVDVAAQKGLTVALETKGDVADSPLITEDPVLKAQHEATVKYVNSSVADSTEEMLTEKSRLEDTPILDFIGKVMTDVVADGIDTQYKNLPIVAQVSPFSRTAKFPKGTVTIKDVAGLYIYDNTLMGLKLTGKEMKEYLEYSLKYYDPNLLSESGDNDKGGGAVDPATGKRIPDYNLDVLTGVNYAVDITKPVGERVVDLEWPNGTPVADDDTFILAVNNYRANGGGKFPAMGDASKIVYDKQVEIRQALIEYGQSKNSIDPKDFYVKNWELIAPEVSVQPEAVKAGDMVTVTAKGLRAEREVVVAAGPVGSEVARGATDAAGAVTLTFTVPALDQTTLKVAVRQGSVELTKDLALTPAPNIDPAPADPAPMYPDTEAVEKALKGSEVRELSVVQGEDLKVPFSGLVADTKAHIFTYSKAAFVGSVTADAAGKAEFILKTADLSVGMHYVVATSEGSDMSSFVRVKVLPKDQVMDQNKKPGKKGKKLAHTGAEVPGLLALGLGFACAGSLLVTRMRREH